MRHKFNNRSQEQTELINAYVNALRALTETCDFGALGDQLICDRIVCGVHDKLHSSKKWRQTNNNNIPVKMIWSPKDICGNLKHVKKKSPAG